MPCVYNLLVILKNCVKGAVILKYITVFYIMRDTLPMLVFISLEKKEDLCKTGVKKGHNSLTLYLFECLAKGQWLCETSTISWNFTLPEGVQARGV